MMMAKITCKVLNGNTYPHREALKALGGFYSPKHGCWLIPEAKYQEARTIIGASSRPATRQNWKQANGELHHDC
jgi:hypothetical protein